MTDNLSNCQKLRKEYEELHFLAGNFMGELVKSKASKDITKVEEAESFLDGKLWVLRDMLDPFEFSLRKRIAGEKGFEMVLGQKQWFGYKDKKFFLINRDGDILNGDGFAAVYGPECGIAQVMRTFEDSRTYNYIDERGKYLSEIWFDSADGFFEGLARVKNDNNFYFIDESGKILNKNEPFQDAGDFHEGFAWVRAQNNKTYFINKNMEKSPGQEAIEGRYKSLSDFSEGFASVVLEDGQCYFIDRDFSVKGGPYLSAGRFRNGFAVINWQSSTDGQFTSGESFINKNFENPGGVFHDFIKEARNFSEGMAWIKTNDGEFGFLNEKGEIKIIEDADILGNFVNGWAIVKYKNGRWNFIDKNFKNMSSSGFEDAMYFSGGFAWIKQDGGWNIINKNGRITNKEPFGCIEPEEFESGISALHITGDTYLIVDSYGRKFHEMKE